MTTTGSGTCTGVSDTTGSGAGISVNCAVTVRATSSVTVQVGEVPLQAPLQPVNVEPAAATAVSVTVAPLVKSPWQNVPQAMPFGVAGDEAHARARLASR